MLATGGMRATELTLLPPDALLSVLMQLPKSGFSSVFCFFSLPLVFSWLFLFLVAGTAAAVVLGGSACWVV